MSAAGIRPAGDGADLGSLTVVIVTVSSVVAVPLTCAVPAEVRLGAEDLISSAERISGTVGHAVAVFFKNVVIVVEIILIAAVGRC